VRHPSGWCEVQPVISRIVGAAPRELRP
jgi:hypothetical protein